MKLPFGNPFSPVKEVQAPNPLDKQPPKSGVVPDPDKTNQNKDVKGTTVESDDPLLDFDKLWQPNVDAAGKPVVKQTGPKSYLPKFDPKVFGDMVGKMDFTKDFTSEELQAVAKGGEEALAAHASMMNKVGRRSFMTAFAGTQKMMEAGLQNAKTDMESGIPEYVRGQLIDSEIESSNPLVKDQAFAPMVKSVKEQFREKFPKASPADINRGVNAYFDKVYERLSGVKNKQEPIENKDLVKAGDPNADWQEWFDLEIPGTEGSQTPNAEAGVQTQ